MLPLPTGHMAVTERHTLTLCSPLSGEYVIYNSALSYIYIYIDFSVANPVMLVDFSLQSCLLFYFLSQSKYKEDVPATHPILLDEPEFEVHIFPSLLFLFFFAHVPRTTCLWLSHLVTGSFGLHLFSSSPFFRMSLSLSLYIIPPPRSFLPPWVHPLKAFLIGLMLCLGPRLLPLQSLHRELLLRLLSPPLGRYL